MSFENPTNLTNETNQEKMEPREVLQYMAQLGERIVQQANTVEAMIEEAKNRGVEIDVSEKLGELEPLGEIEKQLIEISSKFTDLKIDINKQGLKMTAEELEERLKKMDK